MSFVLRTSSNISKKSLAPEWKLWVLPFKAVFKGVGQADPDAPRDE
jgi:hypothetical protein